MAGKTCPSTPREICVYDLNTLTGLFTAFVSVCWWGCSKLLLSALVLMNFACFHFWAMHILTLGHKRSKDQAPKHNWGKRGIERSLLEDVSRWKCQPWLMGETSVPGWQLQIGMTLSVNFHFINCWPGLCVASVAGLFWHATSHSQEHVFANCLTESTRNQGY